MLIPDWKQAMEAEYLNWKCLVCNILAKSPLHLEEQFLVEHGMYIDIDGTEWAKSYKCFHPTILPAPKTLHQLGNTIALFFPVKLLNFFHFPYFLIFVPHFCSRMGRCKEKDKHPPKPRKWGSAHKSGNLNEWNEQDMQ